MKSRCLVAGESVQFHLIRDVEDKIIFRPCSELKLLAISFWEAQRA